MFLKKLRWLESNMWKYFIVLFTGRRNFIPLLSIYYLSLPNTKAQEIGFYTAAGYALSLVFQIPAGIIWDRLGNKTTIVIAKICLVLWSIMFVIWWGFWYFLVWSVLMSLGTDAFSTGNTSAFLHDTLTNMGKEKLFKKISSSMRGRVSFVSIFFIVALPFFTKISLVLPFWIALGIDIVWLLVALSLFPARGNADKHEKITYTTLTWTIKEAQWSWMFSIILFAAIIGAFLMIDSIFRSPYLMSLWYPITYIGFVMWLSRFVWFLVGRYADRIENFVSLKRLMFLELLFFSLYYVSASFINNPYLIGIIFSIVGWYFRWRSEIYTTHIINRIPGQRYKSTILSIQWQISWIIQIIGMVIIWFVMTTSYKLWFLILGISLFILLMSVYVLFVNKHVRKPLN